MNQEKSVKLLVIEDNEAIRCNIVELLEAENFQVVTATNGRQGIELAIQELPSLILCDVMMPKLNGYGVLTQLRENEQTATIPLIFLTALEDKVNTRQGMELGADDYLTKPFTAKELLRAIHIRLNRHAQIEQEQSQKLEDLRSSITLSLPHELRTPLNSILGFTELLLEQSEYLNTVETREMLLGIQTSGKQLFRIIQNFLLYAELEIQAVHPKANAYKSCQQISYPKTIITAVCMQQAKYAQRQEDLRIELQDAAIKIATNLLKKMAEEIVFNAFNFSQPQTPVSISSEVIGDNFVLSVVNQGKGMTTAQIKQVGAYMQFERKMYEQQGAGLGLTIAKRIAQIHGGKLQIESKLGEETKVSVILPVAKDL